ncbi:PQQ-binding-like beta-propeller repeat protein [Streptomyces sp. RS10V-4]|uniref:serine/threonine-protein kinase n=1 Tax=Streptomyces rhizoryzae TaxID=2932493 RepID=UPI002002E2F2|nr:PQQ-binding-like beta-propeller repeat protein [Streptomyces rhizoryzae]MCK7623080.1 PQQ-binding-like beta-propeller repeat protein [Streptomyces rhizoryzae]
MHPLGTGDPLRLGPYRLLGVVGEGGMGKVYAGRDAAGTVAAVKVLRPELAGDAQLARRFVREAQAARAVTGDGVARVLGAQTEGGRPWIATEFLAGPTLDQAVAAHGPFGEAAVRALAASLARTLAAIHAAGLIHRDLKPPNIVLTSSGPRVIDFGIARPEHGLTLTATGQVPVTPGYGAPEQVLGRRVAPAADVFSLGAVLVYAASGRRAFDGGHLAAVQYAAVHDAPDLSGVPAPLRPLIEPLLAKDAAARPGPAAIAAACAPPRGADRAWRRGPLAREITERERGIRELAAPPEAADAARPVARRRLLLGAAAGGAVLAAGGGAAALWWPRARPPAGKTDLFAFPPAVPTPKAHPLSADDGDFLVGGSPTPLWGPLDVLTDDTPAPLPVRDVLIVGARGGGIAAHNVVDGTRRWAVPGLRAAGRYLSLSDRLIAAVDTRGTLRTFVASTGEPRWTAPAEAEALLAADAHTVYVLTKDHRLRAVSRSDARIRWTAPLDPPFRAKPAAPGVTAAGRLVLGTLDGHVLAVDTATGRRVWDIRNQSDGYVRPALCGTTVHFGGRTLTARRITDGTPLWTFREKDPWGEQGPYGVVTAYPDAVYAALYSPRFADPPDPTLPLKRRPSDGKEVFQIRSDAGFTTPVVVQGGGIWTISAVAGRAEVSTVDKDSGMVVWRYRLPASRRRQWLSADGNRVFVLNDSTLWALPVF